MSLADKVPFRPPGFGYCIPKTRPGISGMKVAQPSTHFQPKMPQKRGAEDQEPINVDSGSDIESVKAPFKA
ncbi:hypothetical protein PGTUg99_011748 [Puccinia graminis f. sp. tritici]|uniref:Uncharacterized protein n=1 Tax=Puccinia graminis f. sp. tritici TaxID=56615 RepID=A0A5B0SEK1_PUCGR|nr:hypothetical protein PGTUg99_011748 [Puccinia graminis f. sp. tritici]